MDPSTYTESNRQHLLWNPFQIQLMGAMHYKQCKLVFVCFISKEHTIWTNKPITKQRKWWDSKKNSTGNVNYIVDYSKVINPFPPTWMFSFHTKIKMWFLKIPPGTLCLCLWNYLGWYNTPRPSVLHQLTPLLPCVLHSDVTWVKGLFLSLSGSLCNRMLMITVQLQPSPVQKHISSQDQRYFPKCGLKMTQVCPSEALTKILIALPAAFGEGKYLKCSIDECFYGSYWSKCGVKSRQWVTKRFWECSCI